MLKVTFTTYLQEKVSESLGKTPSMIVITGRNHWEDEFLQERHRRSDRKMYIFIDFCCGWGIDLTFPGNCQSLSFHQSQSSPALPMSNKPQWYIRFQVWFRVFWTTARLLKFIFRRRNWSLWLCGYMVTCCEQYWAETETSIYLRAQCLPVQVREVSMSGINKS